MTQNLAQYLIDLSYGTLRPNRASKLPLNHVAEWLETKEKLVPDLLEEAKRGAHAPLTHYRQIAHSLPTRPELQKPLIEKAIREELTQPQIRMVAQALKRAEDEEEVQSILRQPVSLRLMHFG